MYYITFRSLTRAQVAAAVLEQCHIPSQFCRAPRAIAERGCAYALRVDGVSQAVTALRRSGTSFESVFSCRGVENCEELRL